MWVSQIFGEKTSSNFIFLNKTFIMLNNREKRIVYSRRVREAG